MFEVTSWTYLKIIPYYVLYTCWLFFVLSYIDNTWSPVIVANIYGLDDFWRRRFRRLFFLVFFLRKQNTNEPERAKPGLFTFDLHVELWPQTDIFRAKRWNGTRLRRIYDSSAPLLSYCTTFLRGRHFDGRVFSNSNRINTYFILFNGLNFWISQFFICRTTVETTVFIDLSGFIR